MLKTDKALYLVETQEDYDSLMVELDKLEVVWPDGRRPTTAHYWEKRREKTIVRVYDNTIVYGNMNFYLKPCYRKHHFEVYRSDKVKLKSSEKFVADWYEENKDELDYYIFDAHANLNELGKADVANDKFLSWLNNGKNKPVQTLVKMHLFGYELEQEPKYYVAIPNPNSEAELKNYHLAKNTDGKVVIQKRNTIEIKDNWKLTEAEIKKDFEWAWQFAKEVNNEITKKNNT